MQSLHDFQFDDWTKQWSGSWSILTTSYWGKLYTEKPFARDIDQCVRRVMITWNKGVSESFWRASEKESFGQAFNALALKDDKFITNLQLSTREAAEAFLSFQKELLGKDISPNEYLRFQELLVPIYYPFHIQNKLGTDYLDAAVIERHFQEIEKTRKLITPVFDESERFITTLAEIQASKTGYEPQHVLATLGSEFEAHLSGAATLPGKTLLEKRYDGTVMLSTDGKTEVFTNISLSEVDKLTSPLANTDSIKGSPAFPGIVRGTARIISDPSKPGAFKDGDILVSGMTRPDFLPIMSRASAFITDSGGMLCHAAVVAREMKKPCVVGTKYATRWIQDGETIEVNANTGIITKA